MVMHTLEYMLKVQLEMRCLQQVTCKHTTQVHKLKELVRQRQQLCKHQHMQPQGYPPKPGLVLQLPVQP
jgi:hypothetical protein